MWVTRIKVTDPHLTTAETYAEIRDAQNEEREISDAAAATIASWWQSPGKVGRALAALASGQWVDAGDLLQDIITLSRHDAIPADGAELWALESWVDFQTDEAEAERAEEEDACPSCGWVASA